MLSTKIPSNYYPTENFSVPTKLYNSLVGVDRIIDQLNNISMLPKTTNFPPYNIRKDGDYNYAIEMAVAGFAKDEIEITINENRLTVEGIKPEEELETAYIHKGIADRDFKREFVLADTIEVKSATMENGILLIILENVIPESKKMKKLEIL